MKSLNASKEIRAIKKNFSNYWDNKNSRIFLKNILNRCGRFLSELILEINILEVHETAMKRLTTAINRRCSKTLVIEIGHQTIKSKRELQMLKPIFKKFKKCDFEIQGLEVEDADLEDLFSLNTKMEHCRIYFSANISTYVLYALPWETIKNLEIRIPHPYILLHTVCHVSKCF